MNEYLSILVGILIALNLVTGGTYATKSSLPVPSLAEDLRDY